MDSKTKVKKTAMKKVGKPKKLFLRNLTDSLDGEERIREDHDEINHLRELICSESYELGTNDRNRRGDLRFPRIP